jgi:amino acid adenylation domain-containing protein
MFNGPTPELSILNKHPAILEGPDLLHELVKVYGGADLAIDFLENGSRQGVSYDSLHMLSDALANTIVQALGRLEHASPIVPVFLPQSPDLYIALLGILKAGKAFCPISLDTPEERIRFILEDISADIVITLPIYESSIFKERKIQPLCVDKEPCQSRVMSRKDLPPVKTDDLAYLLYTSGSTGLPKAVAVSHRAVTQSLLAHNRHIPHFSRFLQFAAPTFDVSIFEIFFPLLRGRTLVGCTRSDLLNDLPSIINQLEIDAAELTPTVVSNLLRGRESVPGLKLLLTIGEMLTQQIIDEYAGNSTKGSMLWGMYGPTEASIHCTLQPSFQKDSPVGNIGFPLDTVSAFIIDHATDPQSPEHMTILPIENVGELAIGGPQVADGYLNRPELTAGAFVRHPEFGLLYRTGDKARLLANGTIECLGRIVSGQVKLRGQRVELGEIEQVILKVPGCHTAAAMIIQDSLVAFCATGSHNVSEKAILEVCASWLPKHMVPADIVVLPRMPQLPSGKVDKKDLETRYLFRERAEDIVSPIPDGTGAFAITQLIQRVLGRNLHPHTPLASVGMDSLQSIRIASMLRQEGYNLGAVDVLSARDTNDLNRLCESKAIDNISDTLPSFDLFRELALECPDLKQRQDEIGDIIPCTPLQEAMLAETTFRPEAYCNWIEVELSTSTDFTQVRDAVEILANQHEILRSGFFVNSSSGPVHFIQIIWKNLHPSQIRAVTSFSRNYSLGSTDSLLRPFQLQVNTALAKPRFLFQIYHGLYDGWSFDLLLRDLQHLLSGNSLQPQPQYRKVVEYMAQTQKDNEYNASASYWRTMLHEYHPTLLPNFNGRTMPSTSLRSMRGKSSIQTRLLFDRAREFSLAPQVMFQAALVYLIGSYIDSTDVVIGTVTSGRTLPVTGIEEITGPCIASLPLRQNLAECHTILDLLQKIQASNRDMLQHCAFPLREIAKLCGLRPREKLFDVVFVWQESLFSHHEDSAVRIIDSADDLEFTLTLEFEPHPDCIAFRVTYDPAIFPEAQINHLTHQLDDLVEHFLHQAHESLSTAGQCFAAPYLSIANPSPERKQFQHGPAFAVERWATETPEKEALVLGTIINGNMRIAKQLSYAELNREANQLAHVLLERGVGADELICVLLDKSIELYVSILAVLKTGCGYLPIVPESPPERIKMILEDANIKLCITKTPMSALFQGLDSCAVLDLHTLDQSKYPTGDTDIEYNGSHLAYAVFTSGSTGTPKGVLVTQDNLMSNLDYLFGLYPTSPNSRLLQACSQAFDVSVFEIFFTWYAGMCLCTAVKDDLFQDMERSINVLGVTHLSLTPTVASLINPDHVPNVEFLVTAGEALTEHVRRQWADRGLFQG